MLRGTLEIANAREVAGWAWQETEPDARVSVDILVDDVRIASVIAETYRVDLEAAGIGDGKHSFVFQYANELSDHEQHIIRVCATNDQTAEIGNSPAILAPSFILDPADELTQIIMEPRQADAEPALQEKALLEGCIDVVSTRQIAGWAFDPACPDVPVSLLITDRDVLLGRILANLFRKDLALAGKGVGQCAFEFDFLGGLSPFEPHDIRVRRESDGADLEGSPAVIEPTRAIDASARDYLSFLFAQAKTAGDIQSTIDFMAAETAKLMRRLTEIDGKTVERQAYQQFLSRWRRRLPDAEAAAASQTGPRHILRALVIDDYVPKRNRDAGSHAILSHILALQRCGYEVTFVPALEIRSETLDSSSLDEAGISWCATPYYASVEDVLAGQAGDFDVVYFHRVQNASKYGELARSYCPKARLIFSVADLHHIRVSRQARVEDRPELEVLSQRLKRAELLAAATMDAVITHSAVEAEELAKYIPAAKIHIIPWSVPPRPYEIPFAQRSGIAFIGGYDHQPNLDAAYRLISEIMPRVHQYDPAIKCLLVGSNMPDNLRKSCTGGIEAIGYVDDLSTIFSRIRLTVAPLAFGAGVKGKVLESLAAGVPCVCTSIAAEGIALPPPLPDFVADDTETIAASIYRLHSDKTAYLTCRAAGLDFIAASYSEESIDALIAKAVKGQN